MLEYAGSPSRGAASAAATRRRARRRRCARSTGCSSPASPARRRRPVGGLGRHALRRRGQPDYYFNRQVVYAAVGGVALVVALARRPRCLPPLLAADLRRHGRADRGRARRRPCGARLDALDRPRLLQVPAVRVRQAAVRPRDRRLPRRPRARCERPRRDDAARARARHRSRSCSSSRSPTSARRSSTARRSARCSSSAGRRGSSSPCSAALARARRRSSFSGSRPAVGVHLLNRYQKSRLTCFVHPQTVPAVDDATTSSSRSRRSAPARSTGAASATRRRRTSASCRSTPTDFVFAALRRAARLRRRVAAPGLYLLVLWRGLRIVTVARDLVLGDRRRRDRLRAALPDLRQRRHDDGDRADHRHPACRSSASAARR